MDRLQRTYAHTAWTPADPLAALEPHVRRSILMMSPSWRERLRLAPWTDRTQRRAIMAEILAERRLKYELAVGSLAVKPTSLSPPAPMPRAGEIPAAPLSPYYANRLTAHQAAMTAMAEERAAENTQLVATSPEVGFAVSRRDAIRMSLQAIQHQQQQLKQAEHALLKEQELDAGPAPLAVEPRPRKILRKGRTMSR